VSDVLNLLKEQSKVPLFRFGSSDVILANPALELLVRLDYSEGLKHSVSLLQSPNKEISQSVVEMFYKLMHNHELLQLVHDTHEFDDLILSLQKQLADAIKEPKKRKGQFSTFFYSPFEFTPPYQELIGTESVSDIESIDKLVTVLVSFEAKGMMNVLLEAFQQPGPEVVDNAIRALYIVHDGTPELFDTFSDEQCTFLVSSLTAYLEKFETDFQPESFKKAITLLHIFDKKTALNMLEHLVKSPKVSVRKQAVESFKLFEVENTAPLVTALHDQNWSVRKSAADVLGQLGESTTVEPLAGVLQDNHWEVAHSASLALGHLGSGEAVESMLTFFHYQNPETSSKTIRAFGELGSNEKASLTQILRNRERSLSEKLLAASVLNQSVSKEVIDLMIVAFQPYAGPSPQNQMYSLSEKVMSTDDALNTEEIEEFLIERLDLMSSGYRGDIIELLGELGSSRAISPLISLLTNDQNWNYERSKIVKTLGLLHAKEAIGTLLDLLDKQDADTLLSTVLTLGKLSEPEAIVPLKTLYKEMTENARQYEAFTFAYRKAIILATAASLVRLGQHDGLDLLQKLAKSEEADERKNLAFVLGEVPSDEGSVLLTQMLTDDEPNVRIQVIESLLLAQGASCLPHVHSRLLTESDLEVRVVSVKALKKIASDDSTDLLKKISLDTDEHIPVRIAAIEALGAIGSGKAIDALVEILGQQEEHYYYKTVIELGHLRSQEPLQQLSDLLEAQTARRVKWREVRDEDTSGFDGEETDEQKQAMEAWRARLREFKPRPYMEFELAHSIAMINPEEGVRLLQHKLAKVREGAWMGLAKLPLYTDEKPFHLANGPAAVELIERLDHERMESKDPLFRHAAYRAIDGILMTIEAYGGFPALEALKDFEPRVLDREGVLTRVEWTIDRLAEREEG